MDARKVITLLKSGPSEEEMAAKADLVNGKVPASELPSYVDDVLEFEDLAHFPAEGEEGKIYIAIDTGYTYRWGGSTYVQVGGSNSSYFPIPDGWNKNHTTADLCTSIVGDSVATGGMAYFGKIYCSDLPGGLMQGEAVIEIISDDSANGKNIHIILTSADRAPYHWEYSYVKINGNYGSPAGWVAYQLQLVSGQNIKTVVNQSLLGSGNVTLSKSDVGLGNVDNTSDADKPVSTAMQTALGCKQDTISDLETIRSGAAAGATAVQPTAIADDMEVIAYQAVEPITEAQLAKVVDGKLAIAANGRLYTKYYQGNAIINFHAFDIGHNISGSTTVKSTMHSKEYVILLDRDTRMLSDTGYMPVSAIGDYADNFLEGSDLRLTT